MQCASREIAAKNASKNAAIAAKASKAPHAGATPQLHSIDKLDANGPGTSLQRSDVGLSFRASDVRPAATPSRGPVDGVDIDAEVTQVDQ